MKSLGADDHPGPVLRSKRLASGLTLSETSWRIKLDKGCLSRFERALGGMSAQKRRLLEDVLADAVRERLQVLQAAVQDGVVAV